MLSQVNKYKVMPILRGIELEDALFLTDCFLESDMKILEVSLNQPNSYEVLEKLTQEFGNDMKIGAGTVLTEQIAINANDMGASFFLSPNVSKEVSKKANEFKIPYIPGALSPTEIQTASELGANLIKIFPVRQLGPSYIKDVLASLNNVSLLAVGGVGPENIADYFEAGVKGVGIGSSLVNQEWVKERNKRKILEHLKQYKSMREN